MRLSRFLVILCVCLLATALSGPSRAEEPAARTGGEWSYELDAYYSNVSYDIPLATDRVPNLGEVTEFEIYRYLIPRSFLPRFINVEASVNPMPVFGVYLRNNQEEFYRSCRLSDDFNFIESITAGFREPYALSVFFGNLADFVKPGETRKGGNRAYIGYLFSVGDHHITHNNLIDDRWLEIEWKLKGDRNFADEKLSWSFRVGGRIHENPEIADTLYLGLRRSNTDFRVDGLSWLKNTSTTLMTELAANDLRFLRQEVVFGKKYPLKSLGMALSFDLGGIWESGRNYGGSLAGDRYDGKSFTVVLRPNLVF